MNDKVMNTSLIAGLLSGVAGLLVFLTIHHSWIRPIWFSLPVGMIIASLGGLAVTVAQQAWALVREPVGLPSRRSVWSGLSATEAAFVHPIILRPFERIGNEDDDHCP